MIHRNIDTLNWCRYIHLLQREVNGEGWCGLEQGRMGHRDIRAMRTGTYGPCMHLLHGPRKYHNHRNTWVMHDFSPCTYHHAQFNHSTLTAPERLASQCRCLARHPTACQLNVVHTPRLMPDTVSFLKNLYACSQCGSEPIPLRTLPQSSRQLSCSRPLLFLPD